MPLRVLLQSRLGWPFEAMKDVDASFGEVLREFAAKSFVCYKSWRTVLEAPDGHETIFWQLEKFNLVDLESIYFHYTAASFYTNLTQPPA